MSFMQEIQELLDSRGYCHSTPLTNTSVGTEFNPTYNDNCPGSAIAYTLTGVTTGSGTSLVGVIFNMVIPL